MKNKTLLRSSGIRIITRNSKLALWQANFVKERLQCHYPDLPLEIIGVTTKGDKILDKALDKVGGKGLFIKELETGLLRDAADIAVHCLKDLPAKLNPEFQLAAILPREDAADAFISNLYPDLKSMPHDAVVGTSSARRLAILNQCYPWLKVKLLRGNLLTRLNKLDNGEYDAIILAVAGLKRLDLNHRIRQRLDMRDFLPAIGQGALAIEVLNSRADLIDILSPLNDEQTMLEVAAERKLGELLGASCSVPIAIYASSEKDKLTLEAKIWDIEANKCCQAFSSADKTEYLAAVTSCLEQLLAQGARQIMHKYE